MQTLRRWMLERGGLLFALAFALYVWVACPYIVGNDNAEFSTLGATGGIAHPSGYPGYILWLRAWSWLPASTPASTAALATLLLAVIQLAVLHAACRAWGASPAAATLAVGVYAVAPLVLRYSTEAEAFAGNQLAVSLVLWLAAARGPLRAGRRAFVLGLVAGLGMTNHLTCTLVAPVGIVGVVRAMREGTRVKVLGLAFAGWLIGMMPYLYCFVAPENLLAWPRPHSVHELLDIMLRRQYGGAVGFSGAGASVPIASQLRELVSTLARSWLWIGLPLGVGSIGYRIARPSALEDGEPRAGWIALSIALTIAGPILATQFDVPTADFGLHIVHRFHLLPVLLLVIPVAVGATLVTQRLPARPRLALAAAYVLFVAAGAIASVDVARYRTPAMENMARNTLRSMPPNAVIMAPIVDELDVGTRYLQLARAERPDVLFFRWPDVSIDWYRAKLVPFGLDIPKNEYSGVAAVRTFLAQKRPVFVYWWDKGLRAQFPSYTYGVLVRVLPPGDKPPSTAETFALNRDLFQTFDFAYPLPGRNDEFATWVHRKYVGTWARLADDLAAAGDAADAAVALEMAHALSPQK